MVPPLGEFGSGTFSDARPPLAALQSRTVFGDANYHAPGAFPSLLAPLPPDGGGFGVPPTPYQALPMSLSPPRDTVRPLIPHRDESFYYNRPVASDNGPTFGRTTAHGAGGVAQREPQYVNYREQPPYDANGQQGNSNSNNYVTIFTR